MILAGDIGGTKTNLALYEVINGTLVIKTQQQFSSQEFATFGEIISKFLELTSPEAINAACFGIAGPIIDGHCRTTNLPWNISTAELQKLLKTPNVRLLNDLEATAYGMLYLPKEEFVELNPNAVFKDANRAVIAAGTGLGEGMLFYDGQNYHPSGSEGGHCDFAPLNAEQDKLLVWLRERYPAHVSYERILSGPGIYTLYEFLKESGFAPEPLAMLNIPEGKDKSALVSKCALELKDPLCSKTLELFAEIYGAEASNLALKSLSLGGVYMGGGIAPKILPILTNEHFMRGFLAKGRFEELLGTMPVKISLNAETALLGAAHFAQDKL
ncbi:MAG: glucokinase [Sulfurimonas sp.]|nr:glucokinase [Sulfurimonas sp.]MBU3939029.1 glucokinase [bacterium]MBU4023802.1 glucokinase [bacterium]MBU4059640.1 glucokinase [bacterium]MBU4111097.1 glucokinase [bacterium]